MSGKKKSVLFICLGNICRSPMAEGVFRHLIENKGVDKDTKKTNMKPQGYKLHLMDLKSTSEIARQLSDCNQFITQEEIHEKWWKVDSAALGPWHVGNNPDKRTMKVLGEKGITKYNHTVRQIKKADFTEFDYIFGMDDDNMSELGDMKPKNCTAKIEMLGRYDPQKELIIRDPYYDSRNDLSGFEKVYEQCVRCCEAFLEQS